MSNSHPSGYSDSPKFGDLAASSRISGRRSPRGLKSPSRWLAILGILLLLLGLGFGWRWWQASQAAAQQENAAAGMPMGVPVKLETTQTSTVQDSSEYVGSLESRRSVILKPEIIGRVSGILVKSGDSVQTGDPLVQLKPDKREAELASVLAQVNSARANRANASSELQALQADRIAKQAEVELQNDEFRRFSALVREGAEAQQRLDQVKRDRRRAISELRAIDQRIQASRATLAEAEAGLQQAKANVDLANEQLQDATIVAPFDGTVGDIPVRLGQMVTTNDTLTTVTQNESLDLKLSIPIEKATDLQQGQRVELINSKGDVLSRGQISFISPQANNRAQSILAKATFDNSQSKLRDGQFVRARVIWQERPGILIPAAAISRLGGATFVFVAQPPNPSTAKTQPNSSPGQPASAGNPPSLLAKQQLVKLGSGIQGNRYPVLEGLKSGERVIVAGVLNLQDGVPIIPQGK
ncbi:MAG: efflux RND transporter periplasmic adaptor subunit [Leptolyngbyaceae cyanobacterium RU_5_1]|nr:efflux RND transporter periplasmic adaptor subunit [Leptolyngbyaceae cyanobacterium RU_5_1]